MPRLEDWQVRLSVAGGLGVEKTVNKSIFCGDEKLRGMQWKSLPNGR